MHKNNIYCKYLSPETIIIDGSSVKICEFGFDYEDYKNIDNITNYKGFRWYRAPELLLKFKNINEKVDSFSLGCILAELYN